MFLTDMRSLQGRPEAQGRPGTQGFRKLAPQKFTEAVVFIKNVYKEHARKHEALLRLGLPTLARTCAITADYSGHAEFFDRKVSSFYIQGHRGFFSREFQRNLLFYARLTWLGPCRPFCKRNISWWDFSLEQVGISPLYQVTCLLWAHESTSLDVNKATGMLTSNARGIFCDSITCFETNKCCSNRSYLPK